MADASALRRLAPALGLSTDMAMVHAIRLGVHELAARAATGCTGEDLEREEAERTRSEVTT